jgi:hypothetical protein
MTFLIYVGFVFPDFGPALDSPVSRLAGTIKAETIGEAAKRLNVRRWHGWKKVPGANEANWKKAERKFYFLPEDIAYVDGKPAECKGNHISITVVYLKPTREYSGPISHAQIWKRGTT